MSALDLTVSWYENEIGNLKAKIWNLCEKLESTLAPGFYGTDLSRERLESMLSNIPKSDQLTVFVPAQNVYIKMWFGDGTNMDVLCEGCDNYISYNMYDSDFEEVDGGQMDFNSYSKYYVDDIRRAAIDVVDFACGRTDDDRVVDFIPLTTNFQA